MIKIEMHAHTKGASSCGYSDAKTLVKDFVDSGYGGVVITNHLDKHNYFNTHIGENHKEKTDYYLSLFNSVKQQGEKFNFKAFCGVEVRCVCGTEYIIIGFEPKFLYDNKPLFTFTQEELFRLADKEDIFMYQSHPFRDGVTCGNPDFMHGAEAFNGHFHHVNNNELALEFTNKYNLIKMAGTDYHMPSQPLTSHMKIPKEINDEKALAEYLLNGKTELFCDKDYYVIEMKKFKGI